MLDVLGDLGSLGSLLVGLGFWGAWVWHKAEFLGNWIFGYLPDLGWVFRGLTGFGVCFIF